MLLFFSLSIFLNCFLEPPRFAGFLFVNRKFDFKYYYTVALSSGAKKKNKCCNRPFIFLSLSPFPSLLILVYNTCVTFKCRTLNFVLPGFRIRRIADTNTHTFSFPLPMSSLSVATIFIRNILFLNTSYYRTRSRC